ncbi:MAG: tetratricopeptide repeat protein [Alphaproteobacteria bacterium]|nr:tetratricopeptide repeat protein [Alphaproteobacteria bacterium]
MIRRPPLRPALPALLALLLAGASALAQSPPPAERPDRPRQAEPRQVQPRQPQRPVNLDTLFERLRSAETDQAAQAIESQIWAAWTFAGTPAVTLLMRRGMRNMEARALEDALEDFDAVLALAPDLAEAWNKRATVYFLMGDDANSVRDIQEALRREPRHFGALSGLSLIYERQQNYEAALRAFEAALAIHPRLEGAEERRQDLRRRAFGDPT